MKIIDNKKDYYDYVSGIWGIDEDIVYDRRGSVPQKDWSDKVFSKPPYSTVNYRKFAVLAGEKIWKFCIEGLGTDNMKIYPAPETSREKYRSRPWGRDRWKWYDDFADAEVSKESPLRIYINDYGLVEPVRKIIKNPILSESPITKLIPAEEVWQGIYDYLIKEREPAIEDTRSDVEKLESHGFDKKTSFRKDKEKE